MTTSPESETEESKTENAQEWAAALPTLTWLQGQVEGARAYHNHKENIAWIATAAFLTIVGNFVANTPRMAVDHNYISIGMIVAGTIGILCFLRMQFEMRWSASDQITTLMRVIAHICKHPSDARQVRLDDRHSTEGFVTIDGIPTKPPPADRGGFIATVIALARVLSMVWWGRLWPFKQRLDPRWKTEAASYLLVLLAAGVGIGQIWTRNNEGQQFRPQLVTPAQEAADVFRGNAI